MSEAEHFSVKERVFFLTSQWRNLLIPSIISFLFLSYYLYRSTAYVFVFHWLQLVQTPPTTNRFNTITTGNGLVPQATKSSPSHLTATLSFAPSKTLWIPYQRTITRASQSRLLPDFTERKWWFQLQNRT